MINQLVFKNWTYRIVHFSEKERLENQTRFENLLWRIFIFIFILVIVLLMFWWKQRMKIKYKRKYKRKKNKTLYITTQLRKNWSFSWISIQEYFNIHILNTCTRLWKKYPDYRVYSNRTRLYDLWMDDDVFHLKQSVGGFNDI